MLRFDADFTEEDLTVAIQAAQANYKLMPNDWVNIDLFTNDGERIVDPNFELSKDINPQALQQGNQFRYLIQSDGKVKLPMVGLVNLNGLTIQEAEDKLEKLYDSSYKNSFVKLRYLNKRVIVLGATGGQVIPIENENLSILEVIALAGGMPENGKAHNIRLIRGINEGKIEVFLLDLSRISSMKDGLLLVQESDVIYIEPWKRPVNQALRDISPILGVFTSVLTLILVIQNINDQPTP